MDTETRISPDTAEQVIRFEYWMYFLLALYLGLASCILILAPQSAMAQFLRQQPGLAISLLVLIVVWRGQRAGLPMSLSFFHPARQSVKDDELFQLVRQRAIKMSLVGLLLAQPLLALVFTLWPTATPQLLIPSLSFSIGLGLYAALTLYWHRERSEVE